MESFRWFLSRPTRLEILLGQQSLVKAKGGRRTIETSVSFSQTVIPPSPHPTTPEFIRKVNFMQMLPPTTFTYIRGRFYKKSGCYYMMSKLKLKSSTA